MSDNLSADVRAAASAGMSYGQWKALHPTTKQQFQPEAIEFAPDVKTANCAYCGKPFPVGRCRKYCSPDCYFENNILASHERYHKRKERDKK